MVNVEAQERLRIAQEAEQSRRHAELDLEEQAAHAEISAVRRLTPHSAKSKFLLARFLATYFARVAHKAPRRNGATN